jgi:DNA-binding IclR family transcriptional regulator
MPVLIQSVRRALHILEVLTRQPEGLSVKEIARRVGLNVSTTHHLVNTLEAENYISWLPSGVCGLGLAIPKLYGAFLQAFQPNAHLLEILNNLARNTRETSYITTWQNSDIVMQAIVESPQALRIGGLYVGYQGFAHARASGKALLAYLSEAQLNAYLEKYPPTPLTSSTFHDPAALKAHLKIIARQGYAVDSEEFAPGVCCVAAPVILPDGQVMSALSVSAPAQRFAENKQQLILAVTQAAHDAAALLGLSPASTPTPILNATAPNLDG